MVPVASIITWIAGLGWDSQQETGAPLLPGPYLPPAPDRVAVITTVPGPGLVLEGAADASAFQARLRGGQQDQADAEALAGRLDLLILGAPFPVLLDGGQVLIHAHRLGGTPSPLAPGYDDAYRYEYTCTYLFVASVPLT